MRLGESQGLLINGSTGAGKSTLLKVYALQQCEKRHENQNAHGDWTMARPVLYTTCPGRVTVNSMVEQMLREVGDPAWNRGKFSVQEERLKRYLRDCSVEVVIIDDLHLLLTATQTPHHFQRCTRWLQTLIKGCNITFVVVGVDGEVDTVMESNKQLQRLFKRKELEPFGFKTEPQIKQFNGLIRSFEKAHQLEYEGKKKEERLMFLRQVHAATGGYVGFVAYLFDEVLALTLDQLTDDIITSHKVSRQRFAQAFDDRLRGLVSTRSNPFHA